MAMQLRVYDTFRLKVEQRSDGPESDNVAQTRDAQLLIGIYEAFVCINLIIYTEILNLTSINPSTKMARNVEWIIKNPPFY